MKNKILFTALLLLPMTSYAAIPYRVQMNNAPLDAPGTQTFAQEHRFYIGGAYNFSMWQEYTDKNNFHTGGKNTSSFEGMIGVRPFDTFRIEANYVHTKAEWNAFALTGDTVFINAIFDARIDSMYRILRTQMLVPYVGLGAGISWNSSDDKNIEIENKMAPVFAAMAGIGIEFNQHFALDLGYRYVYMTPQDFGTITDFVPTAHQFRAGARINF